MSIQPASPEPNFSVPKVKPFNKKPYLFIAILLIVFSLTGLVIFFSRNLQLISKDSFILQLKEDAKEISFSGFLWQQRYFENLDKAEKLKGQEQFNALSDDFVILVSSYLATHDPKTRQLAEKLKNHLSERYKKFYREENFVIRCIDSGCGKAVTSPQIDKLRILVPKINFSSESDYKTLIEKELDKGDFLSTKEEKWAAYYSAFQILKTSNSKKPDEIAKAAMKILLELFKADYSDILKMEIELKGEKSFAID